MQKTGATQFGQSSEDLPASDLGRWAAAVLAFCRDQLELGPSQQAEAAVQQPDLVGTAGGPGALRADPGRRDGPGRETERRLRASAQTGSDGSGADHLRL